MSESKQDKDSLSAIEAGLREILQGVKDLMSNDVMANGSAAQASQAASSVPDIDISKSRRDWFVANLKEISKWCYTISAGHGFWKDGKERNKPEMIALMHSELSEALEALRDQTSLTDSALAHGECTSEKIPGFSNLEEEMADLCIRVFDFCYGFNLRLGSAILAKMEYNNSRPHMHGRKF